MAVTLRDVAERAGVSLKTVSNVVNDFPHVRESTRAKVQDAIRELGYRPNLAARNLKYGRSGFIALAVPDLAIPYFAELANKIDAAAAERGFVLLLDITRADPHAERIVLAGVREHMIDGVIFSPLSLNAGEIDAGRRPKLPMVFLGERSIPEGVDHVSVESVSAANAITQHLIDIGRTRIGAIGRGGSDGESTGSVRLEGYRQALEAAGLPVRDEFIRTTKHYSREEGRLAMHALLELAERPDAVFCFNDMMALGALRACHEAGVRVPEDIAVAGFDDSAEGRYTTPTLTTVSPDMDVLVEKVLSTLTRRINGYEGPGERSHVPWRLRIRESTTGRR